MALTELIDAYMSLKLKELMFRMNKKWKDGDMDGAIDILGEFQELKMIQDILGKSLIKKVLLKFLERKG